MKKIYDFQPSNLREFDSIRAYLQSAAINSGRAKLAQVPSELEVDSVYVIDDEKRVTSIFNVGGSTVVMTLRRSNEGQMIIAPNPEPVFRFIREATKIRLEDFEFGQSGGIK